MSESSPSRPRFVQVCQNRSCLRSHSDQVLAEFQANQDSSFMVSGSGCLGQCGSGPMVRIAPDNIWYCRVYPKDVKGIIENHIQKNQPVRRLLHPRFHPRYDAYSFQADGGA